MHRILVIDDDQSIRETLTRYLTKQNYSVISAADGQTGIQMLKEDSADLVISDVRMPGMDGLQVLEKIRELDPAVQVVLITAHDDMNTTVQAMQKGAYDFIEKPLEIERLKLTVKRALETKDMSEQLSNMLSEETAAYSPENRIIGRHPLMKEIYKIIGQVSSSRVTVLIEGESGTGKELVAKSVHYSGITRNHPFVAVNCTALAETLLESELFGHEKGAFTGSVKDKKGKFELAGEGTIFLDEISEMSANLQIKLLRVLQEKEFERVGGEAILPMRARVIAATNRNLETLVREGRFREDLYYRLRVVTITVPPLRERRDDIPLLVNHFLQKINDELHRNVNKVPAEVTELLKSYEWTGNVRELENLLMQAVVLSKGDVLLKENILLPGLRYAQQAGQDQLQMSLADVEKAHIKLILEHTGWNKQKAAGILKISIPTLYSKIEAYGLNKEN